MKLIPKPKDFRSYSLLPFAQKTEEAFFEVEKITTIGEIDNLPEFLSKQIRPQGVLQIDLATERIFYVRFDPRMISEKEVVGFVKILDL